jgi:hypothetical protein
MYLALTYDHRLLDGREAVTFLVKVCFGTLYPSNSNQILIPITGQGVHRGPPPHAARLSHSILSIVLGSSCLSWLEPPLAPSVDYSILKYNRHFTDQVGYVLECVVPSGVTYLGYSLLGVGGRVS